ncbi:MAG: DUF1553 domain-containing protein, partial [Candidatus Hydrogenedentes bacterium]|nr:DUF1553 domain-containing protein [Candidatus Hydrogenedentota bacterium]
DLQGRDRREALAEWLTAPENPWFAKNVANRVWQHFLGKGIIEPADDVRVSNPPSHPDLLDALGAKLVEYEFDLKRLIRDIANSYTYQQGTQPRDPSLRDERNFAFAPIRRLPSEQLLDAISQVTDSSVKFAALPQGARAAEVANGDPGNYFLKVFGRPLRESACTCERRNEPTLAQSLHLINGSTIEQAIKTGDGALAKALAAEKPLAEVVNDLYLAAYCRPPTDTERQTVEQYVNESENLQLAMEDVYWSVLNSKEFVFNH